MDSGVDGFIREAFPGLRGNASQERPETGSLLLAGFRVGGFEPAGRGAGSRCRGVDIRNEFSPTAAPMYDGIRFAMNNLLPVIIGRDSTEEIGPNRPRGRGGGKCAAFAAHLRFLRPAKLFRNGIMFFASP